MGILNWFKKTYSYSFCTLIMLTSSLFFIPNTAVFSAPGDPPIINISSPNENANFKDPSQSVVISGTFTDENITDTSQLIFTATNTSDHSILSKSDLDTDKTDWAITLSPNGKGTWSLTKTLAEGNYNVNIEIQDPVGAIDQNITFTVGKRPYISDMKITIPGGKANAEDLTSVAENAKIFITIVDDQPMTQLIGNADPEKLVKIIGPTTGTGTAVVREAFNQEQPGKYVYNLIYNNNSDTIFKLNTTYAVYLSDINDDSNLPIYAKSFKFTTKSDMDQEDNPHGHYQLNTNMCAACHSTHVNSPTYIKSDTKREGGTYLLTFNEKLNDSSMNYCTACHDGTTNAPIVDKIDGSHHHDSAANNMSQAESCTSCHNPHSERTDQNPNMLQDHYVYRHNLADVNKSVTDDLQKLTSRVIDSFDISCGACHANYLVHDDSSNSDKSIFDQDTFKDGYYDAYSYNKSTTATGEIAPAKLSINKTNLTVSDYSLCLRCHNASNHKDNAKLADIEQYYLQTDSGHNFALPANQTTQGDGTKLNGSIPCAECHETHGSDNINLLREKLGNDPNAEIFKTTANVWTSSDERTFCLKCHNNKTEIYGKTGIFNILNAAGDPIKGHQTSDTQACSECHGGSSKSIIEAAHAPKKALP